MLFSFSAEKDGCFCPVGVLHFWLKIAFLNFRPLSLVWVEWNFNLVIPLWISTSFRK